MTLLAAVISWHATDLGWVPGGPLAADPGFGEASDWDWLFELAIVSDAYRLRGESPEWDPFSQFGEPLMANPQASFRHPAYRIGQGLGGHIGGFQSLYGWSVFSLLIGLAALAAVIDLPPLAGMLTAIVLLLSTEWVSRLTGGHLWILGLAMWPAALAAITAAMDPGRSPTARWLLAAAAGGLLGSSVLMGSHYGAPMGVLIMVFLLWARHQPPRVVLGLLALLWLPVFLPSAPPAGRVVFELGCFGLFGFGLWSDARWRTPRFTVLAGLGLGFLAVAAPHAVEAAWLLAPDGRLTTWTLQAQDSWMEPPSWAAFDNPGSMDRYLPVGSPWQWAAAAVGTAFLVRRRPALAALVVGCVAIAWSSGRPLKPWSFLTAIPGSAAMAEHSRFQIILLIVPALGWVEAIRTLVERVRGESAVLVTVGTGLLMLAVHGWNPAGFEGRTPPPHSLEMAANWGVVEEASNDGGGYLSRRPLQHVTHPVRGHQGHAVLLRPFDGASLGWSIRDGRFVEDPDVVVTGVLNTWTIDAAPRQVVVVAQRDFDGWHCDGADLLLDADLLDADADYPLWETYDLEQDRSALSPRAAVGGRGTRWLTLRMGEQGSARCVWRTPVRTKGRAVALSAFLLVLGTAWTLRRRSSA